MSALPCTDAECRASVFHPYRGMEKSTSLPDRGEDEAPRVSQDGPAFTTLWTSLSMQGRNVERVRSHPDSRGKKVKSDIIQG